MTHPVILHGDCVEVMRTLPDNSIDAIVTDPPYGLGFMGKAWDDLPPGIEWAAECLRVLKPGGHLLAFGGTRTWHRLACAVEDAGFEIRDSIAWLYGSGFPKSMDVSKAIDKAAGAERTVNAVSGSMSGPLGTASVLPLTAPATDAARQWQGFGTALKPAFEPVVMARKPLAKGITVAGNVLAHGTGALNIDACRIDGGERPHIQNLAGKHAAPAGGFQGKTGSVSLGVTSQGRWPANVALDEDQAAALDQQSGTLTSGKMQPTHTTAGVTGRGVYGADAAGGFTTMETYGDKGGASRFMYVAKAPKSERPVVDGIAHPTVKPVALMRWLVRLVTPPGGTVLDPFAGSGTTIEAAMLEGFDVIGIEREADYLPLIQARIDRNTIAPDDLEDPRYGITPPGLFDLDTEGTA